MTIEVVCDFILAIEKVYLAPLFGCATRHGSMAWPFFIVGVRPSGPKQISPLKICSPCAAALNAPKKNARVDPDDHSSHPKLGADGRGAGQGLTHN